MAKYKIYLKVDPKKPKELMLSNGCKAGPYTNGSAKADAQFTTDVETGDKVQWKLGDCSIVSINAILPVAKKDLFKGEPSCKNKWKGKIGNGDGDEHYTIWYRVGNTLYSCDPKISMVPH